MQVIILTELPATTFQVCWCICLSNLLPPSSCLGVGEMGKFPPSPRIFSNNCDVKRNYLWRNLLYAWMKGTHANPQQEREIPAIRNDVPNAHCSGSLGPRPPVQILTSWTQYDWRNAKEKNCLTFEKSPPQSEVNAANKKASKTSEKPWIRPRCSRCQLNFAVSYFIASIFHQCNYFNLVCRPISFQRKLPPAKFLFPPTITNCPYCYSSPFSEEELNCQDS